MQVEGMYGGMDEGGKYVWMQVYIYVCQHKGRQYVDKYVGMYVRMYKGTQELCMYEGMEVVCRQQVCMQVYLGGMYVVRYVWR